MKVLLEQIAKTQNSLGTTLVVGAGGGSCLADLRALSSDRLVLAEADAAQAAEMAQLAQSSRGEEVWPLAIVGDPATLATLHVLNIPRFNSLKSPKRLAEQYPNLRLVGQMQVPARTLDESVAALALHLDRDHLLVLDAPGQAHELLYLTSPKALQSFKWIILRCNAIPLYAEDLDAESLLKRVTAIGFDTSSEDPQSLYPEACFLLTRNETRVRIARLALERDDLSASAAKYKSERDAANKALAEQVHLVSDLQAQIQILVQERDQQLSALAKNNASLEISNRTICEQAAALTDTRNEIHGLTKQLDEQAAAASEHAASLEAESKRLAELQEVVAELEAQAQKLARERDEQVNVVREREADLEKASKKSLERGARVIELEREQSRLDHYQAWLDREVGKAEAQIDLIKAILLRETSL